jgi:D-amino-acid dehydrogenase
LSRFTSEARGSHTIVLGGGIVGLSTAYYLAKRGERVTVIERNRVGVGASSGNAGIIALGHPPLPRPGLPGQLLRLMLDRSSPLYIPPRPDLRLIAWTLSFLRACTAVAYERSLEILGRLGWQAGACIRELIESENIGCEYRRRGWLEVFRTAAGLRSGRKTADRLRRFGYNVDEMTGKQLRAREPAYSEEVVGALHYTDSAFANPRSFITGLAARASAYGARMLFETEARRLILENGRFRCLELVGDRRIEASRVVLAAGSWTTGLAAAIGIRIPMQPGKGYHMDLVGAPARPSTTSVLAETFVAATPLGDGLRLAGTVELSGLDQRISRDRLERLRTGARSYILGIEEADVASEWCGLRPLTADGLPAIGWAGGVEGVFIATGHAMMGFLLGPLTGKLASEILLDGSPSIDIAPLRADRF